MAVKMLAGTWLFSGGQVAMHNDCCCDGGPCDFTCTGTEPTLSGMQLTLTQPTSSGCACSGSGTYLLPSSTALTIPAFSGDPALCYYCWYNQIDVGACENTTNEYIICLDESFPSGPLPTVNACCDAFPDEFGGYIEGYEFCCKAFFGRFGEWSADMCAEFTFPSNMKFTFTVTQTSTLAFIIKNVFTYYRRDYTYRKNPGSFPGPTCDECSWSATFDGDWYLAPGSTGTECDDLTATISELAPCHSVVQTAIWEKEVSITNCCEILDEVTLDRTFTDLDDTLVCTAVGCIVEGTPWPGCASATESWLVPGSGWGCMPTVVKMKWTGTGCP